MSTDRIEKTILLRAPIKRVWRALSDSTEFGNWFGMRFNAPFAPGATMTAVIVPTTANQEVAKMQKPYEGISFEIKIEQMHRSDCSRSAGIPVRSSQASTMPPSRLPSWSLR